ncbi:MAG: hypothetical protein L0H93_20500, partial [Nocardioides sp.]|nr:hypothetical protein [Nocardioides sp.]
MNTGVLTTPHPLAALSPAEGASAFVGAWDSGHVDGLPHLATNEAGMPMWETLTATAVFDLNDAATRQALTERRARVTLTSDFTDQVSIRPVVRERRGPTDRHHAAGVADMVKTIVVDLFAQFDFADPYDKVVWVQGHRHAEPVCAWPECHTYLTRTQMAGL